MRVSRLCAIALCLFYAVPASAQSDGERWLKELLNDTDRGRASLRLTAGVAEQKYCKTGSALLKLRLTFTNTGGEPVILDRRSWVVGRYVVADGAEAMTAGKYLADVSPMIEYTAAEYVPPAIGRDFVLLKPGESFSLEHNRARVSLPLSDGTPDREEDLRPGSYLLAVHVWTWFHDPDVLMRLRGGWREQGFVWSKTVRSEPVAFSIENKHTTTSCP